MNQFIRASLGAFLTAVSYAIGFHFGWIKSAGLLELFSVWTSFWCTYLCVKQSRSNYIIGVISVIALGVLFYQQNLLASMALQIYLVPTLVYGWFLWRRDTHTRPVRHLRFGWSLLGYAALVLIAYSSLLGINNWLHGSGTIWDTMIFTFSVLAQWMLDRKVFENWLVWIVVDIISVVLYWHMGLQVLAIQMGLFGLNALWGMAEWRSNRSAFSIQGERSYVG